MKIKINSLLELINQSDTKDISGEEAIALINKIKTMSTFIKEGEEVQELKQIQEEKLVEKIETTETEVQTDMLIDTIDMDEQSQKTIYHDINACMEINAGIGLREEMLSQIKAEKPLEFFRALNTEEIGVQASDKESIIETEMLYNQALYLFTENSKMSDKFDKKILEKKKVLSELTREQKLYKYHGKMTDQFTQYETINASGLGLANYPIIGANISLEIAERNGYALDIKSSLIMKKTSIDFLDKLMIEKVQKLALFEKTLEKEQAIQMQLSSDIIQKKIILEKLNFEIHHFKLIDDQHIDSAINLAGENVVIDEDFIE